MGDIFSAEKRSWMVYKDTTSDNGYMRTNQTGLLTIPITGWLYGNQGKMVGDDDSLKFIHN